MSAANTLCDKDPQEGRRLEKRGHRVGAAEKRVENKIPLVEGACSWRRVWDSESRTFCACDSELTSGRFLN